MAAAGAGARGRRAGAHQTRGVGQAVGRSRQEDRWRADASQKKAPGALAPSINSTALTLHPRQKANTFFVRKRTLSSSESEYIPSLVPSGAFPSLVLPEPSSARKHTHSHEPPSLPSPASTHDAALDVLLSEGWVARVPAPTSPPCDLPAAGFRTTISTRKAKQVVKDAAGASASPSESSKRRIAPCHRLAHPHLTRPTRPTRPVRRVSNRQS